MTGRMIDEGIAIFFPGPHSFTGEDVLEFQGHGGTAVLNSIICAVTQLQARIARPGEFSERAFLNHKMDLSQAEAIADLINSTSEQGARNALRSLRGEFSKYIYALVEQLTQLRVYVESAIDFPEEDIDFLTNNKIINTLNAVQNDLHELLSKAQQGALVNEGITVAIVGAPNVGKSSLLNQLSGYDAAIVTPIAGTTRDTLREQIFLDGLPIHIVDTAGLHQSTDVVEKIGIERALKNAFICRLRFISDR